MKTIVIGGGPAGMMSAITSSQSGNETILIEKNNSLGKKLLITGKGRCNITSSLNIEDFISNIPGNGKFLYSAFQNYTNKDIINMLKQNGLSVKNERGNRIFPITDRAIDVLNCFIKEIKKNKVQVMTNCIVKKILKSNDRVLGVELDNGKIINADKIILATGGKSYPITGSDGNGYKLAQELGHTITELKPSIVPLLSDKYICSSMQGLSLKNVKITIIDEEKNKKIYDDFGEMLFTHFGVSGPIILSSSAHLVRYKNIDELFKQNKIKLIIDFKPALSIEELDSRILRDWDQLKNKEFKNSLDKLLPKKAISTIIDLSNIPSNKKVNEITKEERRFLTKVIKEFTIDIKGFRPIQEAIVTSGGISIKEINPKTMESKLVKGLYFAGEIIDVDAYTGGFNLQIAYSTGYTAGISV